MRKLLAACHVRRRWNTRAMRLRPHNLPGPRPGLRNPGGRLRRHPAMRDVFRLADVHQWQLPVPSHRDGLQQLQPVLLRLLQGLQVPVQADRVDVHEQR